MKNIIYSLLFLLASNTSLAHTTRLYCGIEVGGNIVNSTSVELSPDSATTIADSNAVLVISRTSDVNYHLTLAPHDGKGTALSTRSSDSQIKATINGINYTGFCQYSISNKTP